MPKAIRYTLLSIREMLISAGPFALLAAGSDRAGLPLVAAHTAQDRDAGHRPGAKRLRRIRQALQKALAANGIQVVLLPSEGSSANLQLLRDGKADLGFVQGGSADIAEGDENAIESLGSLFVEPVWLFYREALRAA